MNKSNVTQGWTEEQIKLLTEVYTINKDISIKELSASINKSQSSICVMAKKLNLRKKDIWTKDDEEFLIRVYEDSDNSLSEISKSIGKSITAVRFKAGSLGLKRESKAVYLKSIGKRKCPRCNEILSFEYFFKNATKSSGISTYCIPCEKITKTERLKRRRANYKQTTNSIDKSAISMKQCSVCKEVKSISEFYTQGRKCKACRQEQIRVNRLEKLKEKGYCD